MNGVKLETHAGSFLARLTPDQREQLDAIDVAYIKLLSREVADKSDVEALAAGVVAFYDGVAESDVGRENGA